ncbi:penicillin-binding protein [Clostridium sp. DMHC 10]|uniref:penicillin-binding transpeptidase domain-containing protein n=1 Tax=Clostridium sp. DMHC 10 TaxID=747377 RepID=UPI00069CEE8D|nr:penicillin-binding transpeptidase domain-containing protein [Clostridium sp. DMHC 10]KOF56091.1 penicillin-binding protein [Clostridium sp. DMHC 10]
MYKSKIRCMSILVILVIAFSFLIYRLYIIMNYNEELEVNYAAQMSSFEKTSDLNYEVIDCNGKDLLPFNKDYYVVINPYIFSRNNSDTNIRKLTALNYILKNYNKNYDLSQVSIESSTNKLYWKIDETIYNNLQKFKDVNGIYTYYVNKVDRSEAADIFNIITNPKDKNNKKFKANNSLEKTIYDRFKNDEYPEKVFKNDSNGNIISSNEINNKNLSKVKLTIDKTINDKVQNILDDSDLKQASAIVMESENGAIRAAAQKDLYDANINFGLKGIYYPGSIFKTIVEEAAIESKSVDLNTPIKDTGKFSQEKVYDYCTPKQAFVVSSNDVFINIGQKTGFYNIYNTAKNQGLFDKVLNIDGESNGSMDSMDSNDTGNLSLLSYGQSLRITPVEALAIPNTVVNKGIYVKPHIVDSYINGITGKVEKEKIYSNRVISENTANTMLELFKEVLTDKHGTGLLAYTPNPCIGGKTGTAQRGENKDKTIENVDAWFAGFFNANGINYSAVIFAPNIDKNMSAAITTAPIFKKIVESLNNKN